MNPSQLNNLCFILPTGYGKSKIGLDKAYGRTLIVVPRVVLYDNWKKEIDKWNSKITASFVTYAGIHKVKGHKFDTIIYDEAHHITKRVVENIPVADKNIFLSATLTGETLARIMRTWEPKIYNKSMVDAIDEGRLPEPKIMLYKLVLTPEQRKQYEKWTYLVEKAKNDRDRKMTILFGRKRLNFLAECKENTIRQHLNTLKDCRTLTFCSSQDQTKRLGENYICSKNKKSAELVDKFNNGEINHITACDMLNEGINLHNCQYGIFCKISSSELQTIQKIGRIIRHKEPYIHIFYFENTQEEKIINKYFQF